MHETFTASSLALDHMKITEKKTLNGTHGTYNIVCIDEILPVNQDYRQMYLLIHHSETMFNSTTLDLGSLSSLEIQ